MADGGGAPATESHKNSLLELVTIVAIALGLALLIQAFLIKPYRIPSESMVPTLAVGQRVLVDRVRFHFRDPHRGDIVVFNPPIGAATSTCFGHQKPGQPCPLGNDKVHDSQVFIKRVVGLPGDKLTVIGNHAYINGKRQNEPFIEKGTPCSGVCNLRTPVTIPPGHYFMMGDNRGESDDSRMWGPVPRKWIIGKAFFTYWPPKRIGTL
jgi:signal peptidase I